MRLGTNICKRFFLNCFFDGEINTESDRKGHPKQLLLSQMWDYHPFEKRASD